MTEHSWKPGDPCTIELYGHDGGQALGPLDAIVHLVAGGKPVAVGGYDGIIDGFVGWLPVLWTGEQAATLLGTPLEITPR